MATGEYDRAEPLLRAAAAAFERQRKAQPVFAAQADAAMAELAPPPRVRLTANRGRGRVAGRRVAGRRVALRIEVAVEPRPRLEPVAMHGPLGDPQRRRDLLLLHPPEEPALHHLTLARVEPAERVVEREHAVGIELAGPGAVGEGGALPVAAAALGGLPVAGVVHQHLPHRPGGDREEVGAVARGQGGAAELEVGLVHQRGGVERALHVLVAQLAPGQPAEVVVDQGQEPVECAGLSLVSREEEAGDFAGVECGVGHGFGTGEEMYRTARPLHSRGLAAGPRLRRPMASGRFGHTGHSQ